MYSKNRTHFGRFHEFNVIYMKFHVHCPVRTPSTNILYEKSSTFRQSGSLAHSINRGHAIDEHPIVFLPGQVLVALDIPP